MFNFVVEVPLQCCLWAHLCWSIWPGLKVWRVWAAPLTVSWCMVWMRCAAALLCELRPADTQASEIELASGVCFPICAPPQDVVGPCLAHDSYSCVCCLLSSGPEYLSSQHHLASLRHALVTNFHLHALSSHCLGSTLFLVSPLYAGIAMPGACFMNSELCW